MDDPGSPMYLFVLYIAFVVLSAFFSGTEIALSSVNRIHIMNYADKGNKGAKRVLFVLDHFDEALSTILIGNNIVNIGCATLSVVIAERLWRGIPNSEAVSVATVVTTVVLFIFGEMLPKCLARSCNESFALSFSGIICFFMAVLKPFAAAFSWISKAITYPFTKNAVPEVTMTEDELHDIVENISEDDGFDEETGKLVKSALKFSNLTVGEIIVPWDNVVKISVGTRTDEILNIIKNSVHSRIPVIGRDGNVRGILQIRRFLKAYIKNKHVILASVMDYPYFVKPDVMLDELLSQLSNHRRNLAIVRDDSGILGIVTIEDILEELVGEIYDEDDIGGVVDE